MHKKLLASLLAFSLIVGSISVAHAESYIITTTWSDSVIIPYEELIDLASLVTIEVSTGRTSASPGAMVQIRNSGSTYYIAIVNASGTVVGYVGSSSSHNVYVASGRGYLYNVVDDIRTYCGNIQSLLTGLANTLSNLYSTDPTNPKILNNIYNSMQNEYFCSYSVDSNNNPYPINHITKATAEYIIAELNTIMIDRKIKYISQAGGVNEYYFVSAYYNSSNYIAITISNLAKDTYYNVYLCDSRRYMYVADIGSNNSGSSSYDDTDVINAINELGSNLYSASTTAGSFSISNSTMDEMIYYLNSHMLGKPVNYVTSNSSTVYYLRGAYKSNNKIRVTLENSNGTAFSTTAYLCNKYRYTYNLDNNNNAVENAILSIPTKIQEIYDWLDNADLSVNQTIINIVNNTTNDVNSANDFYDRVLGLFKKSFGSFDDGYQLTNWGDALTYFDTLWSDPTE